MANFGAKEIKEVRKRTNASVIECKKALEEANGDIEKAIDILREKGIAKADLKAGRETKEGVISAYIHHGGKLGVMVELNCETDFVARNEEFKKLAYDIALHIAAVSPQYISREQVPEEIVEKEKEIYRKQALSMGKPENVVEKIVNNKLNKFYQEICLLEQPFLKDTKYTVADYIKEKITMFGENITVRRFIKFEVGGE
jgi:elongation factor Ts